MLERLTGASSSPSSAWFSSSSWKARFKASMAAKVNVTHRMLGARSTAATAVGSRPKLKIIKTSTVNTTADRIAVRERNSTSRSLRARRQAWRNTSATRHRAAIGVGDLGGAAAMARCDLYEAAFPHERDVGRQLRSLFDVVGDQHRDAACRRLAGEDGAGIFGGGGGEAPERVIEGQHT